MRVEKKLMFFAVCWFLSKNFATIKYQFKNKKFGHHPHTMGYVLPISAFPLLVVSEVACGE